MVRPPNKKRHHGFPKDGTFPGKEENSPDGRGTMRLKMAKCVRPKQSLQQWVIDSDVCDWFETPSPSLSWRRPARDICGTRLRLPDTLDLQAFRDYGEESYEIKRKQEDKYMTADCLSNQPQLTPESRNKLINWLVPVHRHFRLGFESLCLAVNILDRFLLCTPVPSKYIQLVGVTSLLIASKQVETRPEAQPEVNALLILCDTFYTQKQLTNLERGILLKLQFQLGAPTINFFINHLYMRKIVSGEHSDAVMKRALKAMILAKSIAGLSLSIYDFNHYPPSLLAYCSLALADQILESPIQHKSDDFPENMINECMDKMDTLVILNEEPLLCLLQNKLPLTSLELY